MPYDKMMPDFSNGNGESPKLAKAGLEEVVQITRAALYAEIACQNGDLTNPAVVAATKCYKDACMALAIYESPRPISVHPRVLDHFRH